MYVRVIVLFSLIVAIGAVQGSKRQQGRASYRQSFLDKLRRGVLELLRSLSSVDHPKAVNSCSTDQWTVMYEGEVTCSIPSYLNSVIFSCWECSSTSLRSQNAPTSILLNEIVSNWSSKLATSSKGNLSLVLTRPSISSSEVLNFHFKINKMINLTIETGTLLCYDLASATNELLYTGTVSTALKLPYSEHQANLSHLKHKRAISTLLSGHAYLLVTNRFYIHRISLDGGRSSIALSGLDYAFAVDFYFRNNSLYWIDSQQRAIMKSTLDGAKRSTLLNQGLTQPGGIAVDWISQKLYWTDIYEHTIGVMDLKTLNYKYSLISTESDISPRGLAIDPAVKDIYWTEWGQHAARIKKASMDGNNVSVLFQDNLKRPSAVSVDYSSQVLYWIDSFYNKIECGSTHGTGRRLVVSSGFNQPFDITLLGDMLYISDQNLGILATNKSGGQPLVNIYNTFCDYVPALGIQAISEVKQLLVSDPCGENNGGCSHLCLLSSFDSRGFSCSCPEEMFIDNSGLTCSQNVTSPINASITIGSCRRQGYTSCCNNGTCKSGLLSEPCFCDSDCYLYGDCCEDIGDICLFQNEGSTYLLIANILYIHRVSIDGERIKTLYTSTDTIKSIDYNYRAGQLYWSTTGGNGLWRSQLDGSAATPLLTDGLQTIDDIAVDWISNKLYWTENGQIDRIRVLDITSGYYTTLFDTGQDTSPRAIVVDPINRWFYWSDWGNMAKIEKASMDGVNRTVIHDTNLVWPSGLTLDYNTQVLYWTDERESRIESSNVDGSNRKIVSNNRIYRPFAISLYSSTLYFTDFITGINSFNNSTIPRILNVDLCENAVGIEVFSEKRQQMGDNPCEVMMSNGGCSHLCLLSAVNANGFTCACPDGFTLEDDGRICFALSTVPPVTQNPSYGPGSCIAAGYSNGCCANGTCRGSPSTCSCDSNCHVFRDCCSDVHPSCQPAVDVLEFVTTPLDINVTLTDGVPSQQSQFHCSVRASRVTNFHWIFNSSISVANSESITNSQIIVNEVGSLDAKYSVISTDYSSTLTIEDVQFSDNGTYICVASLDSRINPIHASAIHIVQVLPKIPVVMGRDSYSFDQNIHLTCKVEASPEPALTWMFLNQENISLRLFSNTSKVLVHKTYSTIENGIPFSISHITVNNVNTEDSGNYICLASAERHSFLRSTIHTITVSTINVCEEVHRPCLNGGTCVNYEGRYHCICASTYTGRNCSERIDPLIPSVMPYFTQFVPSVVSVRLGQSVNLTYMPKGHPTLSFEWFKDGLILPGEFESFLYIAEVLPEDRGNYSCRATNRKGVAESSQTQLVIPGVLQYKAKLQCNESFLTSSSIEVLSLVNNPLNLNGHGMIYSIRQLLKPTSSNATFVFESNIHLLVTVTVMLNVSTRPHVYYDLRESLTFELVKLCSINVIVKRFDGCETNNSELDLGRTINTLCPCHEYLRELPGANYQQAWLFCDGSYRSGAQHLYTDYSLCATSLSKTTHQLCQAVMVAHEYPYESLSLINNVTTDQQLNSLADISLLTFAIELLTPSASTDKMITDPFLKMIDYYLRLDSNILSTHGATNSSLKVLQSLEQFAFGINFVENNTLAILKYSYQSYGIVLLHVSVIEFQGQTFIASKREDEVTNTTKWYMTIASGSEDLSINNFTTKVHLPSQTFDDCSSDSGVNSSTKRVAYFVFDKNILFQSVLYKEDKIDSVITSARINCSYDERTTSPIIVTYNVSNRDKRDPSKTTDCASWRKGVWSKNACLESNVADGVNARKICTCYSMSYFGVLLESITTTINMTIYFYIALAGSCIILILTVSTSVKFKFSVPFEKIIFIILNLILMLRRFFLFVGAHVSSVPALCGINSGLLQFITLVFFGWAALHSALGLLQFYSLFKNIKPFIIKLSMLFSWVLPFLIISLSASIWFQHYISFYFCGIVSGPLWFGLVLPLSIICTIHLVINVLISGKLYLCQRNHSSTNNLQIKHLKFYIIIINVMLLTFYTTLIFELLFINPRLKVYSKYFQVSFALMSSIEAPLLFMYVFCSIDDARAFWVGILHFKLKKNRRTMVITTRTNEAYETVIRKRRMEDKYTMSKNELYINHMPTKSNTSQFL